MQLQYYYWNRKNNNYFLTISLNHSPNTHFHWCFRLQFGPLWLHSQNWINPFFTSLLAVASLMPLGSPQWDFKENLNICCAEFINHTVFFLGCLLQGQSTCPCCGGSCPQPCLTAPSERSKFSIGTWGYGWRTWCVSKSSSSSAGMVTHQLWGLHRPHRLTGWQTLVWCKCKVKCLFWPSS